VAAGNQGEALLQVVDELCAEIPHARGPRPQADLGEGGLMAGVLDPDDEALVVGLRTALARIASALGPDHESSRERALVEALDGAELTIRGELVSGNAGQLPELMPSLVFMVALAVVDQDRALSLSRRTADLIAAKLG